MKTGQFQ